MSSKSLKQIVDELNARNFGIALGLDDPHSQYNDMMEEIRAREISKSAWENEGKHTNAKARLLAVLTPEQDYYFTRIYGPNYHRNKKFFTEMYPQTLAVNKRDL